MWAAHRPEQRRNILQLTALSSLQVDCTTRFAPCQGIFSASAAFSLWRGVRPASAVVLLTLSILPHVLRRVKGFSKFFSCRPSPLLPLIMYRAGMRRGMGGCEFVAFATVSMVLWWCSSEMGCDIFITLPREAGVYEKLLLWWWCILAVLFVWVE